jgi:hypothetical protein
MGSSRAVFASIGVSVSLVAAAALSLFAVSLVIAFGGWSAGMGESGPATALVFGASDAMPAKTVHSGKSAAAPVVLRAARPAPPRAAAPERAHAVAQTGSDAHARIISHAVISNVPPKPVVQQPAAPAAPASHITATGDGVRRVGEDLSSTAHSTGKALADVTAPLGPPVSAAVQKVLDLVATLLRRTTNSLGGTLDAVGQR